MQYYAVLDYAIRSHAVLHMMISEPVDLQTMADVQPFCILKYTMYQKKGEICTILC